MTAYEEGYEDGVDGRQMFSKETYSKNFDEYSAGYEEGSKFAESVEIFIQDDCDEVAFEEGFTWKEVEDYEVGSGSAEEDAIDFV